jgi:hypothetical protein
MMGTYRVEQVDAQDSERFWIVNGNRYHKTGSGYAWFDSFADAHAHCLSCAQRQQSRVAHELAEIEETIKELQSKR